MVCSLSRTQLTRLKEINSGTSQMASGAGCADSRPESWTLLSSVNSDFRSKCNLLPIRKRPMAVQYPDEDLFGSGKRLTSETERIYF